MSMFGWPNRFGVRDAEERPRGAVPAGPERASKEGIGESVRGRIGETAVTEADIFPDGQAGLFALKGRDSWPRHMSIALVTGPEFVLFSAISAGSSERSERARDGS